MTDSLRRLSVLYELTSILSGSSELDVELSRFVDALARCLVLNAAMVFDASRVDGQGAMRVRSSVGLRRGAGEQARLGSALTARLGSAEGGLQRLDADDSLQVAPTLPVDRSECWVLLLRADGALRGALVVAASIGRFEAFTSDILTAIAPRLGALLDYDLRRRDARTAEQREQQHLLEELRQRNELTQLALAEQSLRGAIVNAALEGILIIDHHGHIIEFNPAAEKSFGWTRDEVLGRTMSELIVPPEMRRAHEEGLERFRSTGEHRILGKRLELPALRADGSRFLAEVTIVQLEGKDPAQFAGFLRDISERKQMEEALLHERARFVGLFEQAPDPVLILDADGRISLANRASATTLSYSPAELVGRAFSELFPAEEREEIAALASGQRPPPRPRAILRKDGSAIPVELNLGPVELDGGRFLVVTLRDISERLHAESVQRQLELRLRQARKMESLGTLAGGVAHYFNNLLAALAGNLELLRQHPGLDAEAKGSLEDLATATGRGAEMVSKVLSFSRQKPAERKVQPLFPIVEETDRLLRKVFSAGIETSVSVVGSQPSAAIDPSQFHQVMVNLLTNAAQAAVGGVARITVEVDTVESPEAPDLPAGVYARIRVADNGCGMNEATLDRIFDPFFTTKPVGQGTGLGLAEVHGIITDHGGTIRVVSATGVGTTFTVLLPAVEVVPPAAPPPAPVVEAPNPVTPQRILFVDDEHLLVRLGQRSLGRHGFAVAGFTNSREALGAFSAAPQEFDLVITDMTMPELTGLQLIAAISKLRPDIPIILVSGAETNEVSTLSLPNPFRVLAKPYSATALIDLVLNSSAA